MQSNESQLPIIENKRTDTASLLHLNGNKKSDVRFTQISPSSKLNVLTTSLHFLNLKRQFNPNSFLNQAFNPPTSENLPSEIILGDSLSQTVLL